MDNVESPKKKRTEKPGRLLQDNNTFTSYGTIFTLSGVKYLDKKVFIFNFILTGSTQLIESEIQDVSHFLFSDRNVFNVTLWA